MTRKEESIDDLKIRIGRLQDKAKIIRADLAEANRALRQRERLAELEQAEAFFREFGHLADKLRLAEEQRSRQQKSPQ